MEVRVGPSRKLSAKELMPLNVVLDKTLESPLYYKEIKSINPKRNQPWIFIGRTDAEAEAPILWPPDAKSWLIRKDFNAGKGWRQEEKRMTENEMVGRHHWLNGREFEQSPGDGDGQGNLACLGFMMSQRVRHDWVTEQQQHINWHRKSILKIQYPFMLKTSSKPGIEGNFFNLVKNIHKNLTTNISFSGENMHAFILKLQTRKGTSIYSPDSYSISY